MLSADTIAAYCDTHKKHTILYTVGKSEEVLNVQQIVHAALITL